MAYELLRDCVGTFYSSENDKVLDLYENMFGPAAFLRVHTEYNTVS